MFIQLLSKYPVGILMLLIFIISLSCGIISIRSCSLKSKWQLSILRIGYMTLPLLGVVALCNSFIYAFQGLSIGGELNKTLLYISISHSIVFIQTGIWMGIILLIFHSILSIRVNK